MRAYDLHPVAELLELPLPVEGAGAGLDGDGAGLNPGDDVEQLVAHHAALQHQAPVAVDAVELEDGLGDIDTQRLDGHGVLLDSFRPSQAEVVEGGPSIPLGGARSMPG